MMTYINFWDFVNLAEMMFTENKVYKDIVVRKIFKGMM